MMLLRRRRLLAAVPITTSPAPVLGAPTDVCAGDESGVAGDLDQAVRARPVHASPDADSISLAWPGEGVCAGPLRPRLSSRDLSDEPRAFSEGDQLGPTPPGYEPGVCHHPGHIMWNGLRFGVTPLTADHIPNQAALTRCHHRRAEGR